MENKRSVDIGQQFERMTSGSDTCGDTGITVEEVGESVGRVVSFFDSIPVEPLLTQAQQDALDSVLADFAT